MHQRADTIVEGLSVRLYVQKKGAFNRVGQQAPIEFRTTKDVAVQHCIDILRIRLTTTFDRRGQSKVAKRSKKTNLSCAYVTLPTANAPSSRGFIALCLTAAANSMCSGRDICPGSSLCRSPHRTSCRCRSSSRTFRCVVALVAAAQT